MKKDFNFDEKISLDFENHIKKSIVGYFDILNKCVQVCEWFIKENSIIYDLGSSKGTLLKMLKDCYSNRNGVIYKGIDNQKAMKSDVYDNKNIIFENKDLMEIDSFYNASVIISIFTIQFIPEEKRMELHQKIYDSLPKGGAFLFSEKFFSSNSLISEINKSMLLEFKLENGFSAEEILEKDRSLRGCMKINDLVSSYELLDKIGYKEYETIYLNNNFALHLCIK